MNTCSDSELVLRAQKGDTQAFAHLFGRHWCDARAVALAHGCISADADDLIQEACVTALQRIDSLRPPYRFAPWLKQIVRNKARNFLSRTPRLSLLPEECDTTLVADADEEELRVTRLESCLRSLSALSPPLRETARLSYLLHHDQAQVSRRLGIPLGTVKRRLFDSRARIKEELSQMSTKGRNIDALARVPEITLHERPEESMSVRAAGPGLYFGSVLQEGHKEECRFYDYPHGILTQVVHTTVLGRRQLLGHDCLEVLIQHSECEPAEPNVLDYIASTEEGFRWLMRITADAELPGSFCPQGEDGLFRATFSSGEHAEYAARVVDLRIGDTNWGRCLAVWWSWQDGSPAESFYNAEGRQVLHRRYVSQNAPVSGSQGFEQLPLKHARVFRDCEYRLWYDTVLI